MKVGTGSRIGCVRQSRKQQSGLRPACTIGLFSSWPLAGTEEPNPRPVSSCVVCPCVSITMTTSAAGCATKDKLGSAPTNDELPEPGPSGPQPTLEEVLQCQFSSWYDIFRKVPSYSRSNVTIKSMVMPLPPSFVDYLLSDGIRLPAGATNVSSCLPPEAQDDGGWSSDEDDDENGSLPDKEPSGYSFPELNERISSAITSLGGAVLPKLNWSSPKDATWMNNGTLKCQTPGDVYLLLKSSDFVLHDVSHAFDNIQGHENDNDKPKPAYQLALRKWCNLSPSMEFRCFVNQHKLGECRNALLPMSRNCSHFFLPSAHLLYCLL